MQHIIINTKSIFKPIKGPFGTERFVETPVMGPSGNSGGGLSLRTG